MLLNQDIKNIHIVIYSEKGLKDMKHYFKMMHKAAFHFSTTE